MTGRPLCSGIISEDLNGNEFVAVPFRDDEVNHNSVMEIGYITRKNTILSRTGSLYVDELKNCLKGQE